MAFVRLNALYSIDIDNLDNIYVLGTYVSVNKGTQSLFYSKLDSSGTILFQKVIGDNGSDNEWYDYGKKALVADTDNIYITGYSYASASKWADAIAIKASSNDLIFDGDYGRWSVTTSDIVGFTSSYTTSDTGFTLEPSGILLDLTPRSFTDDTSLGYELTPLGSGGAIFQADVMGQLNMNNVYILPSIAGTIGQVLTFPSIGNTLVWGTGGGGGSQNLQQVTDIGNTTSNNMAVIGDGSSGTFFGFSHPGEPYVQLINSAGTDIIYLQGGDTPTLGYEIGGFTLLLQGGAPSSNRTQTFQDKNGVIALLSDINGSSNLDVVLTNGNTSSVGIMLDATLGNGLNIQAVGNTINLLPTLSYWSNGSTYMGIDVGVPSIPSLFWENSFNVRSYLYPLNPSLASNWILPNKSGTIALLSDITDGYSSATYSGVTYSTVTHNFGKYPIVQVLDNTNSVIIPYSIKHNSVNDFTVTFTPISTGTIISRI